MYLRATFLYNDFRYSLKMRRKRKEEREWESTIKNIFDIKWCIYKIRYKTYFYLLRGHDEKQW